MTFEIALVLVILAAFRRRYGLNLIGVIRDGEPLPTRYTQARLEADYYFAHPYASWQRG